MHETTITDQKLRDYIAKCQRIIKDLTPSEIALVGKKNSDKTLLMCRISFKQMQVPVRIAGYKCDLMSIMSGHLEMTLKTHPITALPVSRGQITFLDDDEFTLIQERIDEIKNECKSPLNKSSNHELVNKVYPQVASPIISSREDTSEINTVRSEMSNNKGNAYVLPQPIQQTGSDNLDDSMRNPANWVAQKQNMSSSSSLPLAPAVNQRLFKPAQLLTDNPAAVTCHFKVAIMGTDQRQVQRLLDSYFGPKLGIANLEPNVRLKNVCHVDDKLVELRIVHLMSDSGVQRWHLNENDGFLILCDLNQIENGARCQVAEQVRYIESAFNNRRIDHLPILVVGINNDNSDVKNAQKYLKELADSIGSLALEINQYNINEVLFVFQSLSRELFDQLQKKSPDQQREDHGYHNPQSAKGNAPAILRNEPTSKNCSVM